VYAGLQPMTAWIAYWVLGLRPGSRLTSPLLMLFVLVVFGAGIVRSFFTPERTRRILAGQRESVALEIASWRRTGAERVDRWRDQGADDRGAAGPAGAGSGDSGIMRHSYPKEAACVR